MGRLLQIEVENFKSYAGAQVIGPFHDFTCVIGPNGAGKSNLVDSISFVLGVQSRQLRSSTLKDLIFHKDDDSQPRRAVVRLLYQVSEGELEGFHEGDVVCFSRTVTNTSVSLYQFQDRNVTYEHYESILQKIGVLVKVRNFLVFQGDIEAVASKSPAELTGLFEQICGSDALAKEYDSLQVQKDEAEEKTIFAMQKKKMFQTQSKEVKVQRDEANLFNQKQREAKELQTQLLACQLYQLQQDVLAQEESLQEHRDRIEENSESEKIIDEEVAEAKRQLASITKRHGAQDKKLQANKKKLESATMEISQASSKIKILAKRKKEIEKNISNTEADLRDQEDYIRTLTGNIDSTERELRQQRRELEALQAVDLHMSADQIHEYDQLKAQCNQETMSLTKQIQELNSQIQLLSSQRDAIQAQYTSAEKEGANQASLLADCQARLAKLVSLSAGYEEEIRNQQKEKQRHVQNTSAIEKQLQEIGVELTAVTNKLNFYGSEKSRHTQNTKLADSIAVMSTLFEGIHGKLIDLCKPIQKKYNVAINIVLNKYFDAIVVDSKDTAGKCIAYLKEHHVGTATFLPLDSVQATPIPQRFRDNLPSKFKLCLDVLEYDNAYRNAILYAVGSTVLCETLEDAQELAFQRGEQVKIVTLKGQVISRSGAMTGGHTQDLVRDRFQESEIQRLNQQRTSLEQQKTQLEQQLEAAGAFAGRQTLTNLEQAIRALQAKTHYNGVDRTVLQDKIQGIQQQSALRQEQLDILARQLQDLTQQIDSVEQRKQQLQQQIQSVEATIFREFSNKLQVENVIQLEAANQSQRAVCQQQIQALTTQLASLNSQLNYERSKQYSGILDKLRTQVATTATELTTLEKELNRLKDQEEALLVTNQQLKKELQGLTNERELQMSLLKDILDRKADLASQTASYTKQVNALEITMEKMRNTLHNALYNARLEQIPLPGLSDEGEAMDVEGSEGPGASQLFGRESMDTSETEETIAASRSVHFSDADHPVVKRDRETLERLDLSSARKLLRGSSADRARKEQELRESLLAIQTEMSTMQPNLHAAQRYEESMKKLSECQYELDELRTQAKTLSDRFEEVRAQRIHIFQSCFQHVSKALSQVYRDLTKSSKHPLGGNAYLTLDNTDEPFTAGVRFTAMPPMKRFRDMDQLSGGEKTVAALALLFAIHSYRPAPFFVLDEIDAALDNVNVKKVCNYIAQRSSDLQCIVISLKDIFFEHAQSLVGIAKDLPTASSKAFTLDLQRFAESVEDASLEQSAIEGVVGEDEEDEAAES